MALHPSNVCWPCIDSKWARCRLLVIHAGGFTAATPPSDSDTAILIPRTQSSNSLFFFFIFSSPIYPAYRPHPGSRLTPSSVVSGNPPSPPSHFQLWHLISPRSHPHSPCKGFLPLLPSPVLLPLLSQPLVSWRLSGDQSPVHPNQTY